MGRVIGQTLKKSMTNTFSQGAGHSILVIEDDEGIRTMMQAALEWEGYRVLTATNGKEGIDVLQNSSPICMILLDLMMPVMDGWEFMHAIEADQQFQGIPVVVATAFGEKTMSRPITVKQIIGKPIDIQTLYALAGQYCGTEQTHV
jgi:CheY-like chemotaxis protein